MHPILKKHLWLSSLMAILLINACKKQDLHHQENDSPQSVRSGGGVVPDDPEMLAKMPVIMSGAFMNAKMTAAKKGGGKGNTGGGSTSGDVTAPTVAITSPANGTDVSGIVTITVSASDNVGVVSVSLSVDGTTIKTLPSAPYSFSWDASNASSGTHTLIARATDAAGNYSTSSIAVSKNSIVIQPPSSSGGYSLAMPPVQDQGAEFSCVAFAAGYAARSSEEYYRKGASSYLYSSNVFSPEFLYNQTKVGDCGSGTSFIRVLEFLKASGICTWQSMPYSTLNGCSLMPTASQTAEALNYKITSYAGIYTTDIAAIKNALQNKHAVMIAINIDNSFSNAQPGFIWKSFSSTPGVSHAVTICGYDDSKNAFKFINSWGTRWGDAGYAWIDYNFLSQAAGLWSFVMNM